MYSTWKFTIKKLKKSIKILPKVTIQNLHVHNKLIREEKNIVLFLNLIPKLVHYAEYYEIRTCNW